MDSREMEVWRKRQAAQIQEICAQRGLYANVVNYSPSPIPGSNRNRTYIIAGPDPDIARDPLPARYDLPELLHRNKRTEGLFYTDAWVYDLSGGNDLKAIKELTDYCRNTEFMFTVSSEFHASLPQKLWLSEISQLSNAYDYYQRTLDLPENKSFKRRLEWFFKRENSKSQLRRAWLDYFRSDKFPHGFNPITKILGFIKRKSPEVSLDQLMAANSDIQRYDMTDYQYKLFRKYMQECHPEVTYSVSEPEIVDHGGVGTKDTTTDPPTKRVTQEEYDSIRHKFFDTEGWDCVRDLKPVYWIFRKIYYKEEDEPVIASVFRDITLQYAKCDSEQEITRNGNFGLQSIPSSSFMMFAGYAKFSGLQFYIDNRGTYAVPSLDNVNILYKKDQQELLNRVLNEMVNFQIEYTENYDRNRQSLNHMIEEVNKVKNTSYEGQHHIKRDDINL